jgi:activator of 2-hydroxyglutaryl-CoA dehydratase
MMNDKCANGTGRFLKGMAGVLRAATIAKKYVAAQTN